MKLLFDYFVVGCDLSFFLKLRLGDLTYREVCKRVPALWPSKSNKNSIGVPMGFHNLRSTGIVKLTFFFLVPFVRQHNG